MRTFIAIEIDPELRNRIEALRDRLRKVRPDVKWVGNQNTHITLKFIGELAEGSVGSAIEIVRAVAAEVAPFEFHIRGAGRFPPHSGRVNVLWVGAEDPTGSLAGLHTRLDERLAALGVERENKRFSGHITLGRVRKLTNLAQLIAAVDALQDADIGAQRVDELVLFKSDLAPGGPTYTPLARIPLGAAEGKP